MSMPDELTPENCRLLLAVYMDKNEIGAPRISKSIGCSHSTLARILAGSSKPTIEFMKQVGILIQIGINDYEKLSKAQKETISEKIGTVGGGVVGFGTIFAAISASGTVIGLSGAGITAGLATIGAILGGGMIAGIATVAAIPIAAGAAGYAIIKGVKYFFTQHELNTEPIDVKWEVRAEG
ncbi:MAG: hypothetical protein WCU00_05810 [Candidatus Latescibacterota bacterium]